MRHKLFVPGGTCRGAAATAPPAHPHTEIACYLKAYMHQESVKEKGRKGGGKRGRETCK